MPSRAERKASERLDGYRVGGHVADVADERAAASLPQEVANSHVKTPQVRPSERTADLGIDRR